MYDLAEEAGYKVVKTQAEAEQAKYDAEHALESAEKKRDALIKKGEEELENARRQAHDLMQQVQNEAYSLTDELRRIQKDEKTSAAQRAVRAREIARKDTETLLKKTDAKPKPVKEFVPLKEVQIGQEVVIADLGQTATVTARPDRNNMVEVRAGIMKTKVPLSGLCAPDKMDKCPAREHRTRWRSASPPNPTAPPACSWINPARPVWKSTCLATRWTRP